MKICTYIYLLLCLALASQTFSLQAMKKVFKDATQEKLNSIIQTTIQEICSLCKKPILKGELTNIFPCKHLNHENRSQHTCHLTCLNNNQSRECFVDSCKAARPNQECVICYSHFDSTVQQVTLLCDERHSHCETCIIGILNASEEYTTFVHCSLCRAEQPKINLVKKLFYQALHSKNISLTQSLKKYQHLISNSFNPCNNVADVITWTLENNLLFVPFALMENGQCTQYIEELLDNENHITATNLIDTITSKLNPELENHANFILLFNACKYGNTKTVELLLKNKVCVAEINNPINQRGMTPLYVTCEKGYIDILKLLIEHNANIDICLNDGVTPLYIASQNNHIAVVKLLIDCKANVESTLNNGATPLYIACQKNNFDIAKLLLENNANINAVFKNGMTPLYIACDKGFTDIVKLLFNYNPDMKATLDDGTTPLFIACQKGHYDIVNLLLKKNTANINSIRNNRATALYIACQKGHCNVVRLLLAHKADTEIAFFNGATPLHAACLNGSLDIVKLLLENNANVAVVINDGRTPLSLALQQGHAEIVTLLTNIIENGNTSHTCSIM